MNVTLQVFKVSQRTVRLRALHLQPERFTIHTPTSLRKIFGTDRARFRTFQMCTLDAKRDRTTARDPIRLHQRLTETNVSLALSPGHGVLTFTGT